MTIYYKNTLSRQDFKWLRILVLLYVIFLITGCTKFVQVDPPITSITSATVYTNNASAAAVLTGIYDNMSSFGLSSGTSGISYLEGLAADELKNYSSDRNSIQFYSNTLSSSTNGSSNAYYWNEIYNEIHAANAAIEGLINSTGVTEAAKKQLNGEAKFMRAFLNFYAVNLYGDVPLVNTTNYISNNSSRRAPENDVYQQIIQDLKDAQNNLSDNFLDPSGNSTSERVRPNKSAATALLARAYLYTGKWDSAEIQSSAVLNNTSQFFLCQDLDSVFLKNSTEAIWQLQPVNPGYNTMDAYYFVLTSPPGTGQVNSALSPNLLGAFETGDKRSSSWVGTFTNDSITYYYYPYKYKVYLQNQPVSEYLMVFRLAEQYLIRAEARANQGDILGSQTDLNTIRSRAGLPNTTANDQTSLLTAIQHERQVELFSEWGHRWFDLKRTGSIDSVMSVVTPLKGGTWNPEWALIPLPFSELEIDRNLIQNPGYN